MLFIHSFRGHGHSDHLYFLVVMNDAARTPTPQDSHVLGAGG